MLGPKFVEQIHDELIQKLWPGTDPVQANEPRDAGLLTSAVNSPFQTAGGVDVHPLTLNKGAALFRSLISNHPFQNGNKRTAVMALDIFLTANGYALVFDNDAMYALAEKTATYKARGITHDQALQEIVRGIRDFVIPFESIEAEGRKNEQFKSLHEKLVKVQSQIRTNKDNILL